MNLNAFRIGGSVKLVSSSICLTFTLVVLNGCSQSSKLTGLFSGSSNSAASTTPIIVPSPTQTPIPTATPVSSSNAIKWHPGHYAFSATYTTLGNSELSEKQYEIASLRAGPSQVLGIQDTYYWRTLENGGAGVYDFSTIDTDYVQVTTGSTSWTAGQKFPGYSSPRRFGIYVMNEDWFNSDPSVKNLPDYLLNSPTYGGPGPQYGYWTMSGSLGSGSGSTAALWRPAVMARVIALGQALGAHVLPDGYTLDTSPYVEMITLFGETAQASPTGDNTFNASTLLTQMEALDIAMGPIQSTPTPVAFPHTNVANFNNYLAGGTGATQTLTNSFQASGTAAGGPDTFGLSSGNNDGTCLTNANTGLCGLTWGQEAYIGNGSPTASLIGKIPAIFQIQGTELGYDVTYTPTDIFHQLQNTLHATHAIWSFAGPGTFTGSAINGNWWGSATSASQWNSNPSGYGGVLNTITTSTLSQTACPSSYTGGCNTQ